MNDVDRSRDYDGDTFRSDDPDLEEYEYENEEGGLRMPLFLILILVVIAAIVGVWFVAYNQGLEDGRAEGPGVPLVIGNENAGRERPDDPGGLPEPRSSDIFGEPSRTRDTETQVVPREEQIVELPSAPQRGIERPGFDDPGLRGPGQVPPPSTFSNSGPSSSSLPPLPQAQSRPQPSIRPQQQAQVPAPAPTTSVPSPSSRVPLPSTSVPAPGVPAPGVPAPGVRSTQPSVPPSSDTLRAPTSQLPPPAVRVPGPNPGVSAPRTQPQRVGPQPAPAASAASSGDFVVQLASLPSSTAADQTWTRITSRMTDLLSGYQKDVQVADLGARGVFYRLRVGYFQNRSAAANLCETLKTRGQDCLVAGR